LPKVKVRDIIYPYNIIIYSVKLSNYIILSLLPTVFNLDSLNVNIDNKTMIRIRQAKPQDLFALVELLSDLTTVGNPQIGNISKNIWKNIYVATIPTLNSDTIIGSITLLIEPKIIHNGSSVGHIEDVVVSRSCRGNGVGTMLIKHVVNKAKEKGCYKVILDCDEKNIKFYEKEGFKQKGVCMRLDI